MKKRIFKWTGVIFLILLFVVLIVFSASINRAQPGAASSLSTEYREEDGNYHVEVSNALAHVVLYPGALVEPAAYLPLAEKIAVQGFDVHIMRMPFHLAILDSDAVESLALDDGKPIFIGGHSLGGVAASKHVADNPDAYAGLILLASYPQRSIDLTEWDEPVLSISASNDEVMDETLYGDAFENLPESTARYEIQGGNHANFGSYGTQRLDGVATITRETQQRIAANRIGSMILNNLE